VEPMMATQTLPMRVRRSCVAAVGVGTFALMSTIGVSYSSQITDANIVEKEAVIAC
jgi:hypothetical protein